VMVDQAGAGQSPKERGSGDQKEAEAPQADQEGRHQVTTPLPTSSCDSMVDPRFTISAVRFGEDLFVRLSEADSACIRKQGGRNFEVMPGRAMRGYVTVPSTWRNKPVDAKGWIKSALEHTRQMPPKVAASKAAKKPAKAR
jgi:hypothetical protein